MWEIEVIMRDSGMSGVLRDIQAESGMVGNYDTCTYIILLLYTLQRMGRF